MLTRLLRRLSAVLLAPRCLVCGEPGDRRSRSVRRLPRRPAVERRCLPAMRAAADRPRQHCGQCQYSPPPLHRAPRRPSATPSRSTACCRASSSTATWPPARAGDADAVVAGSRRAPAGTDAGARCTGPACASAATTRRWNWPRPLARAMSPAAVPGSPGAACAPPTAQTELDADARQRNVRDAFGLSRRRVRCPRTWRWSTTS